MDGGSRGFAGLSRWSEERLLERNAYWPKCSSGEVWWSGVDDWVWFLPSTEEVAESGDCVELGVAGSEGALLMALVMVSRLWTIVLAGVTVRMVR